MVLAGGAGFLGVDALRSRDAKTAPCAARGRQRLGHGAGAALPNTAKKPQSCSCAELFGGRAGHVYRHSVAYRDWRAVLHHYYFPQSTKQLTLIQRWLLAVGK